MDKLTSPQRHANMAAIHGQGHEVGDDGTSLFVGRTWSPISVESPTVAGQARHRDTEVQNLYLREWLFLAWT